MAFIATAPSIIRPFSTILSPRKQQTYKMESKGQDHEIDAIEYMKQHRITELFDNILAQLVYHKPERPKEFIKTYLNALKKARDEDTDPPNLLDESNILSLFGMMDLTKKGHISLEQYNSAMDNLGAVDYNKVPVGAEINKISQETFVREAKLGLLKAMRTYA